MEKQTTFPDVRSLEFFPANPNFFEVIPTQIPPDSPLLFVTAAPPRGALGRAAPRWGSPSPCSAPASAVYTTWGHSPPAHLLRHLQAVGKAIACLPAEASVLAAMHQDRGCTPQGPSHGGT